jgi:hypothetical protein
MTQKCSLCTQPSVDHQKSDKRNPLIWMILSPQWGCALASAGLLFLGSLALRIIGQSQTALSAPLLTMRIQKQTMSQPSLVRDLSIL